MASTTGTASAAPTASKSSLVMCEIRRFGETTSVRGVSRAFKSSDRRLTVMWSLAVVLCGAVLSYQLASIGIHYLDYKYTTVLKHHNDPSTFPDITVCNAYPLGNTEGEKLSWEDFVAGMKKKKAEWPFQRFSRLVANVKRETYNVVWSYLFTPAAYFSSLPTDSWKQSTAHAHEQLIIGCSAYGWDWNKIGNMDCSRPPLLRTHRDPTYRNCYTIRIPDHQKQSIRGLSIIAFVDDLSTKTIDSFTAELHKSTATGLRVIVHSRDSHPSMRQGATVNPGAESTVWVTQTLRERLPSPWEQCSGDELSLESALDDSQITYSSESCIEVCAQNQIISACGCVSGVMHFSRQQLQHTNYTICGNQTADDGKFPTSPTSPSGGVRNLVCSFGVNVSWDECNHSCFSPCREQLYDAVMVSSTGWPQQSYYNAFYDAYVKHATFADKFHAHARESNQSLGQMIAKNFLQLNVIFQDVYPEILTDTPHMTAEMMVSNVGGLLSLWLGITAMTTFEFVEFVYRIIAAARNRINSRNAAAC